MELLLLFIDLLYRTYHVLFGLRDLQVADAEEGEEQPADETTSETEVAEFLIPDTVKEVLDAAREKELCNLLTELSGHPPFPVSESNIMRLAEFIQHCSPQIIEKARDNPHFPKGYEIQFPSTHGNDTCYFILVTPQFSRILSTGNECVPFPNRTTHIGKKNRIAELKVIPQYADTSWPSCLSQLIQIELDRSLLVGTERQNAFRLLRELAQESYLPFSLFVNIEGSGRAIRFGGTANIHKGRLLVTNNVRVVCVKVLRRRLDELSLKDHNQVIREGVVWRQLQHPNILQCYGISKSFRIGHLSLVSPWMKNGTIIEYLKKHPSHDRLTAIRQIASGIRFLHEHQPPIVHRDIKGANILVDDNGVCLLADFGLVSFLGTQGSRDSGVGTVLYEAPERLFSEEFPDDASGCPADIYSFAWTIVEILCGEHPFREKSLSYVAIAISRGDRISLPPSNVQCPIDSRVWEIVEYCWHQNPNNRLEIEEVAERLSLLTPAETSVASGECSGNVMICDATS